MCINLTNDKANMTLVHSLFVIARGQSNCNHYAFFVKVTMDFPKAKYNRYRNNEKAKLGLLVRDFKIEWEREENQYEVQKTTVWCPRRRVHVLKTPDCHYVKRAVLTMWPKLEKDQKGYE